MLKTLLNKHNRGWIIFVLALLFLLSLGRSYHEQGWFYTVLDRALLVPRKETYTELYFYDASSLPLRVTKRNRPSFSFVVRNHEGRVMSYPYRVFLSSSAGTNTSVFATGTIMLEPDEQKVTTVQLSFPKTPPASLITVQLAESEKEIYFHINNSN